MRNGVTLGLVVGAVWLAFLIFVVVSHRRHTRNMAPDIRHLELWIEEHPRLAWVYTIGLAVLICELAVFLNELTKRVQ